MRVPAVLLFALGLGAGCGNEDASCIEDLDAECSPLYAPTFDAMYTNTIDRKCTLSCHDAEHANGGLDLSTPEVAYEALVDGGLVVPGSPGCSTFMMRLEGHRLDVMPPGAKLPANERCAIQQWIEDGAER